MKKIGRNRLLIYTAGVVVLAVGLALNSKTGLGVSPVLSVSYAATQLWGWSLGNTVLAAYCFFVLCQFLLRGKNCRWYDLLQIPFTLIYSRILDLVNGLIVYDHSAHSLPTDLAVLTAAILCTGTGISLMINMDLIANPADGIAQALAERTGWEQGLAKNIFDGSCVAVTLVMSLLFGGQVIGIGLGTVLSVIGVGRTVALVNRLFRDRLRSAAGLV